MNKKEGNSRFNSTFLFLLFSSIDGWFTVFLSTVGEDLVRGVCGFALCCLRVTFYEKLDVNFCCINIFLSLGNFLMSLSCRSQSCCLVVLDDSFDVVVIYYV